MSLKSYFSSEFLLGLGVLRVLCCSVLLLFVCVRVCVCVCVCVYRLFCHGAFKHVYIVYNSLSLNISSFYIYNVYYYIK